VAIALLGIASRSVHGQSGVIVDAEGVLRIRTVADATGQLARRRQAEARAVLEADLARPSPLRKVALNRLEQALGERLAAGAGPTDEMRYLAGLTRIQYVFFYPETNDLVIAGPAEGYMLDLTGRPIGLASGRSILELQDLVVALRAFGPDGRRTQVIRVSIDPTQEGLARMQQFLQQVGGRALPADTSRLVQGLRESLGLQQVRINGVSPQTHFAQVLVEADYRMKLIGIGLERPPVKIVSYVERANPSAVARNALQRWYFVPNYESVRVSDNGLAMELVGEGVQLVGADELVRADGTRVATGQDDRASKAFVDSFTQRYPELARHSPVYAQLRNLIDMAIVAAFIQQQDYYSRSGWALGVLGDEQAVSVETYEVPRQVETAVNALWKGRTLMTPIGGGVHIQAAQALSAGNLLPDEGGKVQQLHQSVDVRQLGDGRWWWD